jgi:hypothetical protein
MINNNCTPTINNYFKRYEARKFEYVVDFTALKQINPKTGKARDIRHPLIHQGAKVDNKDQNKDANPIIGITKAKDPTPTKAAPAPAPAPSAPLQPPSAAKDPPTPLKKKSKDAPGGIIITL